MIQGQDGGQPPHRGGFGSPNSRGRGRGTIPDPRVQYNTQGQAGGQYSGADSQQEHQEERRQQRDRSREKKGVEHRDRSGDRRGRTPDHSNLSGGGGGGASYQDKLEEKHRGFSHRKRGGLHHQGGRNQNYGGGGGRRRRIDFEGYQAEQTGAYQAGPSDRYLGQGQGRSYHGGYDRGQGQDSYYQGQDYRQYGGSYSQRYQAQDGYYDTRQGRGGRWDQDVQGQDGGQPPHRGGFGSPNSRGRGTIPDPRVQYNTQGQAVCQYSGADSQQEHQEGRRQQRDRSREKKGVEHRDRSGDRRDRTPDHSNWSGGGGGGASYQDKLEEKHRGFSHRKRGGLHHQGGRDQNYGGGGGRGRRIDFEGYQAEQTGAYQAGPSDRYLGQGQGRSYHGGYDRGQGQDNYYQGQDYRQYHGGSYSQRYQGQDGYYDTRQGRGGRWDQDGQGQRGQGHNDNYGQGRRSFREENPDVFLSKGLSYILRHGAQKEGFKLMPGGFLFVDEMLKRHKFEGFTVDDVLRVVEANDKKRFAVETDQHGRLKIRANQGHSLDVEGLELKPVTNAEEFPTVIHGTYKQSWEIIKKQGLCRMTRNHIHFAPGVPGEDGVISGMRSSCEVMIFLDLEKCLKAGLKFFLSANNVLLSPGDENGMIYPCFFQNAVLRRPFSKLDFDNTIDGSSVSAEQLANEMEKSKKKKKKKKKSKGDKGDDEDGSRDDSEPPEKAVKGSRDQRGKEVAEATDVSGQFVEEDSPDLLDCNDTEGSKTDPNHVKKWPSYDTEQSKSDPSPVKTCPDVQSVTQSASGQWNVDSTVGKDHVAQAAFEDQESGSSGTSRTSPQKESQEPPVNVDVEVTDGATVPPKSSDESINDGLAVAGLSLDKDEDTEDVLLEEVWDVTRIDAVDESVSAVEYLVDNKVMAINCMYQDMDVSTIVIAAESKVFVFNVARNPALAEEGKLKELFYDKSCLKIFHDVADQSSHLFNKLQIVLDGTNVWDTNVMYGLALKEKQKNVEYLKQLADLEFCPSAWADEDDKSEEINPDDFQKIIIDRCRIMVKTHHIFESIFKEKIPKPDIFEAVNSKLDRIEARKVAKEWFKEHSQKGQQGGAQKGAQQKAHGGSPSKSKKGKKK